MIPSEVFEQALLKLLAPIRPFLDDPRVTEIMINGHEKILVEREGRIEPTEAQFAGKSALMAALRAVAQYVGHHVDEGRPILEAHLPDGSRLEAILPPAAPDGPHVSIRRFFRQPLTLERLIELGALDEDAATFLATLVACKQNIIVAGGTGSGKTSFLNALAVHFAAGDRVVVIEDNRELQLPQPHVLQLEARPPDARGRGAVTIRDLFRATLRMRPDRIVVGEIRGGESLDLVQAMTSGHGGCLSTVHATYPIDTLNRLETMALMSDVQLPLGALRAQISSAIDLIVQTARLQDGTRKVTHVTEVTGYDPNGGYLLRDLYVREYEGRDDEERIASSLVPTGALPACLDLIRGLGHDIPPAMREAARARRRREA
jgi:pilus assembly protein CpaF